MVLSRSRQSHDSIESSISRCIQIQINEIISDDKGLQKRFFSLHKCPYPGPG